MDIRIEQGVLRGGGHDGVHHFLGVPYAAPPVGDLRWHAPVPPANWEGVRDATRFGNAAIQTRGTGYDMGAPEDEDCLTLNVWSTTSDPDARQPVMFWIHGGGFLMGAASMPLWTGENLARRGVTVVSCNYRLGAFGFLHHPDAGANFAILDWVAALTWVRENIGAFGGDPGNVTIFGQSAGGAAVRALLSTPSARGLFHRGIIQSAGYEPYAVVASPSFERVREASNEFCVQLGSHDLEQLRQVPAERVRETAMRLSSSFSPPGHVHTPASLVWYPTVDGNVMTDDFSGWPADVPVLFGATQDEARMFVKPTGVYSEPGLDPAEVYTPATLENMARALGGTRAGDILVYFASTTLSPYEALAELFTAAIWHEPAYATFQRFAGTDRTTYCYRFARVSPGARRTGELAHHVADVPYLFGSMAPAEHYDGTDTDVSSTVQHAWTEFARTGTPRNLDGTAWPETDAKAPQLTIIGATARPQPLEISPVVEMINSTRERSGHRHGRHE